MTENQGSGSSRICECGAEMRCTHDHLTDVSGGETWECPDCGTEDIITFDGGIAVGSYEDLEPDRGKPIDRNPSLPCKICGESFNWQDYWKDRILSQDCDPREAVYWCDECEQEIEEVRRRLSNNTKLTEWNGREEGTDSPLPGGGG